MGTIGYKMKKTLIVSIIMCLGSFTYASPYFRTPFSGGPLVHYAGVFIDPKTIGQTTVGNELALVTHDPKDGCFMPSVVCEQWAPIATGLSINGGRLYWDIGPTVNVFPWMVAAAAHFIDTSKVAPADSSASFAFGPKLGLNPVSDGKLQPLNSWHPRLLLMTALQLRW